MGPVVMSMVRSWNGCRFFLKTRRVQISALAVARENFIYNMVLRSPFDWNVRFSIWTYVSSRYEVAAPNIASVLAALAP